MEDGTQFCNFNLKQAGTMDTGTYQSRRRSVSSASTNSLPNANDAKNMIVAVRVRPLSNKELSFAHQVCCEVTNKDSGVVSIRRAADTSAYLKSQAGSLTEYAFDEVFGPESTQTEVYNRTTKPFIPKAMNGFNVTVFAYGATSAGKTHTMFGNTRSDEAAGNTDAGIIPNAVADVFRHIRENEESTVGETWNVVVSFIEVYNESILDLLNPSEKGLSLREDQDKGIVVVAGATEQRVRTLDEVIDCLMVGSKNRKTESTNANQTSSRSHAVLQLVISHTSRSLVTGKEITQESKLSLIDLAGSERASATTNNGARLQEGASINKSLLALANCINALAENQTSNGKKVNVKFRDSKLTLLLKNSLEGKGHLIMICNICPSHVTYEDSHNTLKYANRAKNIQVNPVLKDATKEGTWVEREVRLLEENARLRERVTYLEQLVRDLRAGEAVPGEGLDGLQGLVGNEEVVEVPLGEEGPEAARKQWAEPSITRSSTGNTGKRKMSQPDACTEGSAEQVSGASSSSSCSSSGPCHHDDSSSSSCSSSGPCHHDDLPLVVVHMDLVDASVPHDLSGMVVGQPFSSQGCIEPPEAQISKRPRYKGASADDEALRPPPPPAETASLAIIAPVAATSAEAELPTEAASSADQSEPAPEPELEPEPIAPQRDSQALRRRRQSAIPMPSRRGSLLPTEESGLTSSIVLSIDSPCGQQATLDVIDQPVVFDLGCVDDAPRPPRRGRASITAGSRLATNRRKSMVAISTMLDNLSSIGVPLAAMQQETDEEEGKRARKGRRGQVAMATLDQNAPPNQYPPDAAPTAREEEEEEPSRGKVQTRRMSLMTKPRER